MSTGSGDIQVALIGLAGALIGAIAGGVATYLVTRYQIKSSLTHQFRQQLVEHCRAYFDAMSRMLGIAELRADGAAVDLQRLLTEHAAAGARAAEAHGWLALIAPRRIRGAVRRVMGATPSSLVERAELPADPEQARRTRALLRERLDEFMHAVRVELGVAKPSEGPSVDKLGAK